MGTAAERRTYSNARRLSDRLHAAVAGPALAFDGAGRCAHVTPACARLLRPGAGAVGRAPAQLGLPADLVRELERHLHAPRTSRRGEVRLGGAPSGRLYAYHLAPATDGTVVVTLAEVTDRRRAECAEQRCRELEQELAGARAQPAAAAATLAAGPLGAYAQLVETSPDAVAIVDRDFVVRGVNAAYCELRGRAREEVLGRFLAEVVAAAGLDDVRRRLERAFAGETVRFEEWFDFFTVGRRWMEVTDQPLWGPSGAVEHVGIVMRDLTERRRAEEARDRLVAHLDDERGRLRAVIEQLPAGVVIAEAPAGRIVMSNARLGALFGRSGDRSASALEHVAEWVTVNELVVDEAGRAVDWILREVNPAFVGRSGVPREEALGARASILYGADLTGYLAMIARVLRTGTPERFMSYHGPLDWHFLAVVCPLGERRFATMRIDLTQEETARREHAASLAEAERQAAELEAVVASITDGLVLYRADGGITRLNATARALLGYGPALEGESLAALARRLRVERADGSPCPAAELPAARALLGEVVRGVMLAFHPPAGDPVWVAVSAGPILAADGALRGAVATLTDITPLRRLQEQRDDFVHMVSHDLRSPLTGVLLQAELLGRRAAERGDGPSSQGLQSIIRNAHQMAAMIGDLVDSTRLESGQLPLELAPLALGPFLSEVMRHLGGADVARIRVAAPAELPAARGDGRQLERVVTNLITNAVKYSPPGSPIVVTAEAVSGELRVSIADAGPGIPAEDQPHLFARYYRARQTTRTEGLGLGLYITRLLVEAHGGRIWVESAPGRGSTFRFTLPTAG